jgi:hypothetical protein
LKIISVKVHGLLDYATVAIFALIPSVFGLSGIPAYLSYALSGIHLLMTVLTDFPLGIVKVIPVKIHKFVETAVGPLLIGAPWILGFADNFTARWVYILVGAVIIAVGLLTDYYSHTATKNP